MKNLVAVLFIIIVFASLLPFTEGTPEKRALDITSLTINFDKTDATFTVNYDLGTLPKLYILLLGSKGIEPKIRSVFSDFDYEILRLDQDKAVLKVRDISRFEKGYYLHDSHKLGETINILYIYIPGSSKAKEYSHINTTPPIFYRS